MSNSVSFRLTHADLTHLAVHGRRLQSVLEWTGVILMTGILTFTIWHGSRAFFNRYIGFSPGVQLSLFYATIFTVMILIARNRVRLSQKSLVEDIHTVTVTDDHLTLSNSRGIHSLPWSTVRHATSDANGIYITTPPPDRLIIPFHAFDTREHFDAMLQKIRELIRNTSNAAANPVRER